MARVTGQAVPPSLAARLSRIVRGIASTPAGLLVVGAVHQRGPSTRTDHSTPLARFAFDAATWFRNEWRTVIPAGDRAEFYAQRKTDILTARFEATHWAPATLLEDLTEYGAPAYVLPNTKPVNPAYFDPARKPSNCPILTYSDTYPTPADDGTPGRPCPGWAGAVQDGIFGDAYHAQRRLTFSLPIAFNAATPRPVALLVRPQIHASATIRGNVVWFICNTKPYFHASASGPIVPENAMHTNWFDGYNLPLVLPDDDGSGWTHDHNPTLVRDVTIRAKLPNAGIFDQVWLRLATPPSRGLYFSRNDAVTVRHHANVSLYVARRPGE